MKTLLIKVSGKVQGVFYRKSTYAKAVELGLTGKVSNQPDDTVHILVTGEPAELEQLVSWCWQGPPRAEVTNIIIEEKELLQFPSFSIDRQA